MFPFSLTDPCNSSKIKEIPYIESRHPDVRYGPSTSDATKYCDLNVLETGVWYISNYTMTTTCVQPESCGSRSPIWLNGLFLLSHI